MRDPCVLLLSEWQVLRVRAAWRVKHFGETAHRTREIGQQVSGSGGVCSNAGDGSDVLRAHITSAQSDARNHIEGVKAVFVNDVILHTRLERVAAAQPGNLVGSLVYRSDAPLRIFPGSGGIRASKSIQGEYIRNTTQRWQQACALGTGCPRRFEIEVSTLHANSRFVDH